MNTYKKLYLFAIGVSLIVYLSFAAFFYSNDSNTQHKITCYRNSNVEFELSGEIKKIKEENYILVKDKIGDTYNINTLNYDYCKWISLVSK
ncbi:hypothetical protein ACFGZ5_11835 [Pasteurella multocida]